MTKNIYLDNSTTTKPSQKAVSAMIPFLTDYWGAANAPHSKGRELFPYIEESLHAIYALLHGRPTDRFIFTSSGAEAINQVVFSVFHEVTRLTGKNHYITSSVDEAGIILSLGRLEESGCVSKMAAVNAQGQISSQAIAEAMTPRTALVSLSWANGLTGVIQPVAEIAKICKERGVLFHLDATHVLGKLFFDPEEIGADIMTFNGDHLHAPKGTGGLYAKEKVPLRPLLLGGSEQGGYRAGSANVAGWAALGYAAKEAVESLNFVCTETARLRDRLETEIVEGFSEAEILFRDADRLPHCTTLLFPGIANEALLFALDRKGVQASIGGGSSQQLALLLQACGVEETLSHTGISFSLSRYTTEEEIERAIGIIVEIAKALRKTSEKLL